MGKPLADPGEVCPLMRKDVSRVCHKCAWFVRVEGMHPQTGDRIDRWMCAITAQFLATIDVGRAATVGAATTQELRNDFHREREVQTRLLASRPIDPVLGKSSPNGLLEDRSKPE